MASAGEDQRAREEKGETLGDLGPEDFRYYGHQIIDWLADYLSHPERYPVLSQVEPGQIKQMLPPMPPRNGESMDQILADLDRIVLPGITHWNHPSFFAYFAMNGSAPGILGDVVAAGLNVNAMMWRTSPAATELEEVTLDWLRQMLGLPEEFAGIIYDTASISSLCAIAAAREALEGLHVREQGLMAAGAPDGASRKRRLRLYTSEHAHSSIDKAAITLGIGIEGIRKISTDSEYRMHAEELARAIKEDRAAGWLPFSVVATVGTTSTTSIDPVRSIAEICERERLWLHVDAAYGGSAAVVPEMRWVLDGCVRADSIVVNPHKWFFVPFDLSALYCRRPEVLRQAFSLIPEYLRAAGQDEVKNFMDYGPQLGRRFRALKLWFAMRYFGSEGLIARIRNHIEMAREFAEWVDDSRDFERLAPAPFSTVCFRARPADLDRLCPESGEPARQAWLNALNERLLVEVNREGKVFLSHTKLGDTFVLRLSVGHVRTTREHVRSAWDQLSSTLARITASNA